MELSNKTLALILVVATSISLVGTILTIDRISGITPYRVTTGRALTDTATSNFSINGSINIVFLTNLVDFGLGQVNTSGLHNCTLNTTGPGMLNGATNGIPNLNCTGFYNSVAPLVVQNQGTANVSLNLTFNATPAQWIGGTNPAYSFRPSWNETGACGVANFNNATVNAVTTAGNYSVCNYTGTAPMFNWVSSNRTLNIDLGMRIPQDAPPGERRLTITAYVNT